MFHVKHSKTREDAFALTNGKNGGPDKVLHVKHGMGLLGAYAFLTVVCLAAAAFGFGIAGEYALVGIVEECLCTGLLFGLLTRHFANGTPRSGSFPWRAALLTALVFALCHLAQLWKLPLAFAFSLCMIWIYRRTGSLWWSVCAHTMFDICWFGLIGLG